MSIVMSELIKYQRTNKGTEEVSNRKHKLSARQRQFLLLIDKTDALNQQICKKLFKSINIEQLVDLGLLSTADKLETIQITDKQEATSDVPEINIDLVLTKKPQNIAKEDTLSDSAVQNPQITDINQGFHGNQSKHMQLIDNQTLKRAVDLSNSVEKNAKISRKFVVEQPDKQVSYEEFAEIKQIMMISLRQTCGLLAADLMMLIEKSPNPQSLRKLTARWRTTMLESKFDKTLMEAWFNDVKTRLG